MTEEERPGDERQRNRRRWRLRLDGVKAEWPVSGGLTLAGTGFIGVLVVVLGWLVFHPQSQFEVPNLAGISRPTAEALLRDGGLNLRTTYDEVSDQPVGTVLRTVPAAGAKLDHGAGVSLIVAFPHPGPTSSVPSGQTAVVVPPVSVPGPNSIPNPVPKPDPKPNFKPGPGTGTKPGPGTGTKPDPGTGTKPDPGTGTKPDPGTGTKPDPGTGTKPDPGTGTKPDPGTGTKPDPGTGTGTGGSYSSKPGTDTGGASSRPGSGGTDSSKPDIIVK